MSFERRMIVDGYNVIHASDELKRLADADIDAAREELVRLVTGYVVRQDVAVEVVFDGGRRGEGKSSEQVGELLKVTRTGAGRSADAYIESVACGTKGEDPGRLTVVTGDYNLQKIAAGAGLLRMSPREFLEEMAESRSLAGAELESGREGRRRGRLADRLPDETRERLERIRDGNAKKAGK